MLLRGPMGWGGVSREGKVPKQAMRLGQGPCPLPTGLQPTEGTKAFLLRTSPPHKGLSWEVWASEDLGNWGMGRKVREAGGTAAPQAPHSPCPRQPACRCSHAGGGRGLRCLGWALHHAKGPGWTSSRGAVPGGQEQTDTRGMGQSSQLVQNPTNASDFYSLIWVKFCCFLSSIHPALILLLLSLSSLFFVFKKKLHLVLVFCRHGTRGGRRQTRTCDRQACD